MWLLLCGVAALAAGGFSSSSDGPIVETPLGKLQGWERTSRDGKVYQAWTKVPYAQPPVGSLRLKEPLMVKRWESVLDATVYSPQCMQQAFPSYASTTMSEDCLYLNIFRPKVANSSALPVLVYIHGGAFQIGNSGPRESADYLMDEQVVLVQVHYRLNAFGFMSFNDQVVPGNMGLKDQVMALKWIKECIASFGGNPKSITVFGESAGAASSHLLLKSPLCDDLVNRAVSSSGTATPFWSLLNANIVKNSSMKVVEQLKCSKKTSEDILTCLQSVDAITFMKAISDSTSMTSVTLDNRFVPVIEPKDVEGAFATEDLSLRPSNKPWITSFTNGEYLLFSELLSYLPQSIIENLEHNLQNYLHEFLKLHVTDPNLVDIGADLFEMVYFPKKAPLNEFVVEYAKLMMDYNFVYPAIFNMKMHRGPKWLRHMEYAGELSGRDPLSGKILSHGVAGHAEDILYYFNRRSNYPGVGKKETPEDYAVSKRLIKQLVNFAYYDNPTPEGSPIIWNQFDYMEMLRVTPNGDVNSDFHFYRPFAYIYRMWQFVTNWQ